MQENEVRIKLEKGTAVVTKGKVTPELVESLNNLVKAAHEQVSAELETANIPPLQKGARGINTPTETTDSPPLAGAQGVDDWVTCPTCDGTQELFVENTFDGGDIVPCMKCRNGKVRKADEQARKALNIVNKVAVLLLIGLLCLLFYRLDFPL